MIVEPPLVEVHPLQWDLRAIVVVECLIGHIEAVLGRMGHAKMSQGPQWQEGQGGEGASEDHDFSA